MYPKFDPNRIRTHDSTLSVTETPAQITQPSVDTLFSQCCFDQIIYCQKAEAIHLYTYEFGGSLLLPCNGLMTMEQYRDTR